MADAEWNAEPAPEGEPEGEPGPLIFTLKTAPKAEGEVFYEGFDTSIITTIIMPTVGCFIFLIGGLMIHSILKQRVWWRTFWDQLFDKKSRKKKGISIGKNEKLLTSSDAAIVEAYMRFSNRPSDLLRLLFPALISLTGSPTLLMVKNYLNKAFFTTGWFQPNINDVLYCFLIPAGMLYATVFGFSLQTCVLRYYTLQNLVVEHNKALRNAITSIVHDPEMEPMRKMRLMRNLKDEIIVLMQVFMKTWEFQIRDEQERRPINLSKGVYSFMIQLYDTVGIDQMMQSECEATGTCSIYERRNVAEDGLTQEQEQKMIVGSRERLLYVSQLCSIVDNRWQIVIQTQTSSMNIVQWLFLECLAYSSYFGILMLVASSAMLELVMCTVTVMSISMFSYILSDISSPLHGFFCLNFNGHINLLQRMQKMAQSKPSTWGRVIHELEEEDIPAATFLNGSQSPAFQTTSQSPAFPTGRFELPRKLSRQQKKGDKVKLLEHDETNM